VSVIFRHNNKTIERQAKLLSAAEVRASHGTKGYLGIGLNQLTIERSSWSAPINAVGFTWQLTILTLKGIGHALGGLGSLIAGLVTHNHTARVNGQAQAESQVGGPVAIMEILWGSGSLGINFVLVFIAIISLTLALMNILPIPALDGGRLAMMLVSRGVFKRPLSEQAEERIVGAGMLVLLILIALITIVDVKRF
ncbi:MAG TPA: site-2 protease family protein, partial [Candidatus Saccharimonadales bacterium]|nr:site-2 protease family protein [Candidatus Saccharimonadales bacterium]